MDIVKGEEAKGLAFGIAAYGSWGLFPIYWKLLSQEPVDEVLAHRVFWSTVFLVLVLGLRGRLKTFWHKVRESKQIINYLVSSLLICTNWCVFIWAVQKGYVLESSLGYFICPLINVLFGLLLFSERLNRSQWFSVGLSLLAVLYLTYSYGRPPWISLVLATSFAAYGAVRKKSKLNPLEGLLLECLLLALPVLGYLIYLQQQQTAHFFHAPLTTQLLLVGSGMCTALPLIWFAAALQLLPLTSIAMLQYLAPSVQFILAITMFNEDCDYNKLIAFILIWTALVIFTVDLVRRKKPASISVEEPC